MFLNPDYKILTYPAIIATLLAGGGSLFISSEFIKIIGIFTLTGISYGILNDIVACHQCIEYFTVGHGWDGRNLRYRPINTLNPILNAIIWGMIATWHVSAIAGLIVASLSRMPLLYSVVKITSFQLIPWLSLGAVVILTVAQYRATTAQRKVKDTLIRWELKDDDLPHPYTLFGSYYDVPTRLYPQWHAQHVRNSTGYAGLAIGGLILSGIIMMGRYGLFAL